MTKVQKLLFPMLLGSVLALPGCGNGSAVVAGIDRGGLKGGAVGTISGFGSVIVNDVHYDTANADITVNGAPAIEADLEVGYFVVIQADVSADGSAPSATAIDFSHDLIGPITVVDALQREFVVLGQTVIVDDATVFDSRIDPASVDGLAMQPAGQVVKVSGLAGTAGTLLATRVELGEAAQALEVTGIVSSVDSAAMTLQLGALVIDFSNASLEGFDSGQPTVGDRVEAKGQQLSAGGALIAQQLKRKEIDLSLDDGSELEIEGLVMSFASQASFSVSGFPVATNAQTVFKHGDAAMLALGVRVEVEGSVDVNGVLIADEVEFKLAGETRVEALVDAVDTTAGTLTVLGITVRTDNATSFEDKSPAELRPFGLQDINPGDPLRVRGTEVAGSPGTLLATRIERSEPLEKLVIRGIASNVTDPQFTVLGVTVITDNQTDTEDDFFMMAEGRLVHVEGDTATGSFVAEKVEIKN